MHHTTPEPDPPATAGTPWPSLVTVVALATLPYASLVAANPGQGVDLGVVATWWVLTLLPAGGCIAVLARWRPRLVAPAAVIVATVLWLSFHYPVVAGLGARLDVPLSSRTWWGVVAAVLVALAALLARRPDVQRFVTLVAPLLLLAPLAQAATAAPAPTPTPPRAVTDVEQLRHRPDVYWFVLDGLAGVDYLRDQVGLDTAQLVTALEADGFDVLHRASTNYPFTHLSVSSALEMTYLYDGVAEPPAGPYLPVLQGANRTVDTFLGNGYRYVHAYPGNWNGSRCGGREDVCLRAQRPVNETSVALAATTPVSGLVPDRADRASVAAANDPAEVTRRILQHRGREPTFAFVHLMNPHPPYLRDADCALRAVPMDLAAWGEGTAYRDAVTCLGSRLAAAVDAILATDPDPVILLTGDHGPRLGLSAATRGSVLLDDEMHRSAFSAIRLPAVCDDIDPPEDLTLVNTFRIVFACLAGREPDLLEDHWFPIRRDYG